MSNRSDLPQDGAGSAAAVASRTERGTQQEGGNA
jgi:hypothetical protein